MAGDADSFVGWPSFDQALVDPAVASSLDRDRENAAADETRDRLHSAVAALNAIRELMRERPARHTPGDWRALVDAVLDEAPR
jgi:hypothetical protein